MASHSRLKFPPAFWVLLPFGLLVWRFHFVCDDAFISFRYARNLASGFGLRYNPGVDPPVEGFSNFLWVIVLSLVQGLGGDPVLWAQILSVACALGLLALFHRHLRRRMELSPGQAALVVLFLATLPPFAVWSTGGLATLPFALALFATYHVLLGGGEEAGREDARVRIGVRTGLLALTCALLRADGVLWAASVLGLGFLTARLQKRRRLLRATLVAAAILVAGFALFELGRLAWFGDPFPNTARIKVGFGREALTRGFHYVAGLLLAFPALVLVPAAGLLLARGRTRAAALQAGALVGVTFLRALLEGGDFMAMGRFLVAGLPFAALLLAALLVRIDSRPGERRRGAIVLTALAVALSLPPAFNRHWVPAFLRAPFSVRREQPPPSEYEFWRGMKQRAERWALLGKALRARTRPGESLVFRNIGAVGYYSELRIFDQLGLTSREAALSGEGHALRVPGHDVQLPASFFLKKEPTYLEARVRLKGEKSRENEMRDKGLPAGYSRKAFPLDGLAGFPPGAALVVVRRNGPTSGG